MLVFLGAVFWSLNAPLVKLVTVDGVLVCGARSLIAAIVLSPFIHISQLKWNKWMLLYIISYAALSISIITALNMTDAAIAIGMQYTSIIWLWMYELIKGQKLVYKRSIPVVLVIVGVILFMSTGAGGGQIKGNLIALSEGLFFLGMTVSSPKATKDNPIGLTAISNLVTGIFVILFLNPNWKELLDGPEINWCILIILGSLQVGGGYALYNIGLQKVLPQKAAMLSLWEMILGPAWVAIFLKEYPSGRVVIGFMVILVGLFLDALWGRERRNGKFGKTHR